MCCSSSFFDFCGGGGNGKGGGGDGGDGGDHAVVVGVVVEEEEEKWVRISPSVELEQEERRRSVFAVLHCDLVQSVLLMQQAAAEEP